MQNNLKKARHKFYLVILIFTLPLIVSGLLFSYHDHFHFKTTNHGTLIDPPIQANYLYQDKNHVWRVIYVNNGTCDEVCEKTQYQLNQMRKALGKDQNRLFIMTLHDQNHLEKLKNDFASYDKEKNDIHNKIYLVDPLGNLFMYYPSNANPMNILKDLKKVLGVSQIG